MDKKTKMKQVRDSIHGYIEVPEVVFHQLIDTEIFQRLRQIEQTSMRSLYPSAHHDRFIHSLGVYHLGQLAYRGLRSNLKGSAFYLGHENFWTRFGTSFQLACLLHDCAHAPMSHSFEHGYLNPKDPRDIQAKQERLIASMTRGLTPKNPNDEKTIAQVKEDTAQYFSRPEKIAPHELVSALLTGEYFRERLRRVLEELWGRGKLLERELTLHIQFMQRAIIGLRYGGEPDKETSFRNCLISLLNGGFFDVDKLDYIVRDSALSGANNMSIDIPRILRALTLVEVNDFPNETKVEDLVLNNAVSLSSFQSEMKDIAEDTRCEIVLNLENVFLDGQMQGEMAFRKNVDLETSSGKSPRAGGSEKFKKMSNVKAEVHGGSTVWGRFTGRFDPLNSYRPSSVDGIIHAKISCVLKGRIIGSIGADVGQKITYEVGYDKSALSVIEDTLIARNRLYLWIYAHHKVTFNDYLLRNGVLRALLKEEEQELGELEKREAGLRHLRELMDVDRVFFARPDPDSYLLSDGDLIHAMKQSAVPGGKADNPFARAWLARDHMYPVWKSYAEYNSFFMSLGEDKRKEMYRLLFPGLKEGEKPAGEAGTAEYPGSILTRFPMEGAPAEYVWIRPAGIKLKEMDTSGVYIVLSDGSVKRLKDVQSQEGVTEQYADESFFYLYTSVRLTQQQKLDLVSFLKTQVMRNGTE